MPLVAHVRAFMEAHGLGGQGLVGVSGGLDSVVLLHALRASGADAEAAHVNYGLRGAASDGDQRFVEAWAAQLGVALHVCAVPPSEIPRASRQAWARQVRYDWFAEIAAARGLHWVAVAHHAGDQAETVLLNLLRGTGVAGLGGMRPVRRLRAGTDVRLVRPLLDVPRADVLAYARAHDLKWREDASNADVRYRRAWVRTRLMPALQKRFGDDVAARIALTAGLVRTQRVAPWQAEREALHARAFTPDGVRLDVLRALGAADGGRLLLDALERFIPAAPRSAAVAARLGALGEAQVGRHVRFGAGTVWRERDRLRFVPAAAEAPAQPLELLPGASVTLPQGRIEASRPEVPPGDPRTAPDACWLDADRVAWPLVVRRWQPGDRMQPLGMTGRKKISDLLTDARLPASERARVPVVCSGSEIVWVPGVRASEAAKIRPETQRAVRLRFHSGSEGFEKL